MHYYEVLVSTPQFHGKEPLTYSSEQAMPVGSIVNVPLRNTPVAGVIVREVRKPTFNTKPLTPVVDGQIPPQVLKLIDWLGHYYPAPLGALAQLILPSSLVRKRTIPTPPPALPAPNQNPLPKLSQEQQAAYDQITTDAGAPPSAPEGSLQAHAGAERPSRVLPSGVEGGKPSRTFLVHGGTGTGKTRLYTELALRTLAEGKSVLILTPEIGLTPQLEHNLKTTIPHPIITIHSNLTAADRRSLWLQILQSSTSAGAPASGPAGSLQAHERAKRSSKALPAGTEGGEPTPRARPIVVLGPRSALFTPIANLGLLVVDEAHDQAYKQEQAPHYQALRVASQLANLHGATLVLGTATPLISEYWLAEAKHIPILRLTHRPAGESHRTIEVVSLKEREHFPRQPHLSLQLLKHIHTAINNKQQALVFLNRRGTARLVMCQLCGWTATCPHCDLPLTYHGDTHTTRCHTCGYYTSAPTSCPECRAPDIIFKSIGTKSIVEELQKEFPHARIQRFDTDNKQAERLEQHYHAVQSGEVDIIVGTQMLAKGLDLPKLAVVGVVIADTSLYFPDYTAEERTYQLLSQVIGRVGRGHNKGTVVIQTYSPESPAIQAAIHEEQWPEFYQNQLAERQLYGFPPFYYFLKLSCIRASSTGAKTAATKLAHTLERSGLRIQLVGPAPSFHEKQGGKYRWQIIVKAKQRSELLKVIPLLPANWNHDLDPSNLL